MKPTVQRNGPMLLCASVLCLVFLVAFAQSPRIASAATEPPPLPTPPTAPANPSAVASPVVGISGATSATGASLGEADIRHYVTTHNLPGNMGSSAFSRIARNPPCFKLWG